MCCLPSKSCCVCLLLVLVILVIGFVFGFGVFAHGFHKLKDAFHLEDVDVHGMRPFSIIFLSRIFFHLLERGRFLIVQGFGNLGFGSAVAMRLKKGSRVEVRRKEAPPGSWWCAEIISGNRHTYSVKYDHDDDTVERVPRKAIRPCPPSIEGLRSWVSGDIVEVFERH